MSALQNLLDQNVRAGKCKIKAVLSELDEEDSKLLEFALKEDSLYTVPALVKVLDAIGHKVSETSVRRHRRSECSC